MPYWVPAGLVLAAWLPLLWIGGRIPLRVTAVHSRRAVMLLTIVFAVVYSWLGFWQFRACQSGMMDFGIYDSLLHLTASGQGVMQDYRGGTFDHFSPAILLLVPLYWLYDWHGWLILIQAAALAATAPLVWLLAVRILKNPTAALAVAAATLLNPYVSRLALYDFHIEAIFPAVFLAAFLMRANGRKQWFWWLLAGTIFLKEDFAVPIVATGLWMLLCCPGERRAGALLIGWTAIWVAVILLVYFPLVSENGYWHYGRYDLAGGTAAETGRKLADMAGRVLLSPETLPVTLSVLLPFALLPLADWRFCLFAAAPVLAVQLASTAWHQHILASHYASALIGVMPVAAIFGWQRLRHRWRHHRRRRQAISLLLLITALAGHWLWAELPLARYHADIPVWDRRLHGGFFSLPADPLYWNVMAEQERAARHWHRISSQIPAGATVAAQNELGPSLLRRCTVRQLPGTFTEDFYCFDRAVYQGYDGQERINETLTRLQSHPDYRLIFRDGDIVIFAAVNGKQQHE